MWSARVVLNLCLTCPSCSVLLPPSAISLYLLRSHDLIHLSLSPSPHSLTPLLLIQLKRSRDAFLCRLRLGSNPRGSGAAGATPARHRRPTGALTLSSRRVSFLTSALLLPDLAVLSRSVHGGAGGPSKNTSSLWLPFLLGSIPPCLPLCPPPVITAATYGSATPATVSRSRYFWASLRFFYGCKCLFVQAIKRSAGLMALFALLSAALSLPYLLNPPE